MIIVATLFCLSCWRLPHWLNRTAVLSNRPIHFSRGAGGSWPRLVVVDERGQSVSACVRESAGDVEQLRLPLGREAGVYLLQVSTLTQSQTMKLVSR